MGSRGRLTDQLFHCTLKYRSRINHVGAYVLPPGHILEKLKSVRKHVGEYIIQADIVGSL